LISPGSNIANYKKFFADCQQFTISGYDLGDILMVLVATTVLSQQATLIVQHPDLLELPS